MRHLTKLRPISVLYVDDQFIIKIFNDLALFDQVPSLAPMKYEVVRAHIQINIHRMTHKGGLSDKLRELYRPLISRFYELFSTADLDQLKAYLKDRWKMDVHGVAFPESPD